jgi:mitochondrial fission protein ELM1
MVTFPRIWVFPGNRPGDDAQVYALAEELRLPFETRPMAYNWRFWSSKAHRRVGLDMLKPEIRERHIVPPWPDLILCAAKHSVPAARWIREQNGGRTRLVYIGHPRVPPDTFDLVFTTRSYLTPTGPSMRELDVALSRYREPPPPTAEESAWLAALPRPRLLLMLGGKTRHWKMTPRFTANSAEKLHDRARELGGSLVVARSLRTDERVLDSIEERLEGKHHWRVVRGAFPRFPVLLADADELFPTFDSVSMISESIITGKPTGIVPIEMNLIGRIALGPQVIENSPKRDLRRFSRHLLDNRFAGTIGHPLGSATPNPAIAAAQEVRGLLERDFGTLPA